MPLLTSSLAYAAAAKEELLGLDAGRPETAKLFRAVCRWWNEIEALFETGAITGKAEASNTGIKHINIIARSDRNPPTMNRAVAVEEPPARRRRLIRDAISPRTLKSL